MEELIPFFITDKFKSEKMHGSLTAYTMFIDIVGFTSLTARLLEKGNIGAEELSLILNKIFEPLVDTVYNNGGFIPYYAGDAFLAIFEDEDVNSAEQFMDAALSIQQYFQENKKATENIEIKIGISHGNLDWGIVGNGFYSYFFNGFPITKCAYAQSLAKGGEIVMDEKLFVKFPFVDIEEIGKTGFVKINSTKKILQSVPKEGIEISDRSKLKKFLPEQILVPNLIGEFRTVVSVFISFTGLRSYDELNAFATKALTLSKNFAAYFKEIDFSDKGGVIVVLFGAPVSFEHIIDRALEFINSLKEELRGTPIGEKVNYKAGMSSGKSFTGMIGGRRKKQYAALGNKVNIAARLMSKANWGEVLVDEVISRSKAFSFTKKGEIRYKGLDYKIPTYILEQRNEEINLFEGKFIGRSAEVEKLNKFIVNSLKESESGGVVNVFGEAGVGKSRLLHEVFLKQKKNANTQWIICQADQILRKAFNPLIYFLRIKLKQNNSNSKKENLRLLNEELDKIIESAEENVAKELTRTKSVIAGLLGIKIKNSLWQELDARGRFNNSISSISNLFIALSHQKPLIIEVEDGHWFDESTIAFLRKFILQMRKHPMVMVLTSRYLDNGSKPKYLTAELIQDADLYYEEIDLNLLDKSNLKEYAEHKLEGSLSQTFLNLLYRTTNGNPFYLEQILEYFTESEILKKENNVWTIKDESIKLSDSMNAILMARVDRLSELVKETVKTAAVIGREFEVPILHEVMKSNQSFDSPTTDSKNHLDEQIKSAEKFQIWKAVNELKYIFRHSLLRETVYEMQLSSRLKELHGYIGTAIEVLYKNEIESKYEELSFHFDHAGDSKKALSYSRKAADVARNNYQNKKALSLYEKALVYLDKDKKPNVYIKVLLRQAEILELIGEWEQSIATLKIAVSFLEKKEDSLMLGRTLNQLGKIYNLKGDYGSSIKELMRAMNIFSDLDDDLGLFKSYGNLGDLYFRQADYGQAKEYFLKSISLAKEFKKSFTVTQIVSNLGLTYMNQSEYEKGIQCQLEQLEVCKEIGDRNGRAILNTNLGIVYAEKGELNKAMEYFETGLALSEELGNKQMKAIALGSIGSIHESFGAYDKALELFEIDLKLCKELGDKRGICIVHGLLGELLLAKGKFGESKLHLDQQLKISKELNYQKGITKALISLADLNLFLSEHNQAEKHLKEAVFISEEINYQPSLELALDKLFDLYLSQDVVPQAKLIIDKRKKVSSKDDFHCMLFEARLAKAKGELPKALHVLEELSKRDLKTIEASELYYFYAGIKPKLKEKAVYFLNEAYNKTPHYSIKQKLNLLENEV